MKISEHELGLLANLSEECAETAQVAMKAIRFGLESYHPDDPDKVSNMTLIAREFGNIKAVVELLELSEKEIERGRLDKHQRLKEFGIISKD